MEPYKILMLVKDARYGKCDNNSGHMWETWNTHYEDWNSENRNYKKFLAELKSLMKICDDDDVKIVYLDDDNDEIPIECDEELREALNVAYFMNREYKRSMPIVIKNSEEDATKLELIEAVVENSQKQEKKKRVCSDSSFLQEEPDAKIFFGKNVNYPNRRERSVRFRESPTSESTAHPSDSNFIMDNVKETMDVVNKKIEELKMELLRMKVNKISLNECSEPPAWFKLALDQFKNEILLEVEMMLDERLGVTGENCELKTEDDTFVLPTLDAVGNTESKTDVASQSTNKPSTSTYTYNPRCKKLLRKLEELYEKERRLDMRMEKMESKKIKMWEKMALKNEAKMENTNRLSRFNASVEQRNPIHVVPSKDFVINWKIKNTGVFAWDEMTEMRVFELSHGLKACHKKIKCPQLQPSCEGDISVRFLAPAKEGIYSAKWLLFHAKKQFGPWICIKVIVENQPSEDIPVKASENDSEIVENNKVTTNENCVPEAHIPPTENTTLMRDYFIPKDDDLSDTEIVLENLENWNLEDSDDDPFVIVPMPTCFFPDKPVDSNDVVHMKLKRKSAREQKSRKTNENNDIQAEKTGKETSLDGAVGGTIPDEPYESVEGSVYMVDKAGKCFLINDSNEEVDGKVNDSGDNKKVPAVDDRPFVVRDKINKCVYLNRKEQPIPLPAFKSEKIFIDDPEFSNTKYFMCDGVIVDKGVLVPLFDPHYEFNMGFYQPGPISPTAQPEFAGPFPFSTVPPPPPPITFPPPQIYQSFIPPPPPPHIPRPPPAPLAPPFHPFIVPPHHVHLQQHMPEHFSNIANQQWDYLQHINRNPNFTTNPTNDLSQINNNGLLQQNNEIKKDDSCKNLDNSCIPSSTTESKSMKKSKSTKEPSLENITSRKHKLNMFRMKKMKILSEGESSGNDKKKSDGNIKKLKLHPMYDCSDFELPAPDDVINPSTETITIIDTASNNNNSDGNNTSLVVSANEETPNNENNQTNSPPVNILPEGLVNGTVHAAVCAYSTAVSALNSLMTFSRVDDSAPVTDDDKLQRGLATLHEMGFQNTAKNARLLKKYNYSVAEAVENYCMNLGE